MEKLNKRYIPKPLVIAERFKFHKRNQMATETIAEYCAALRKHATYCQFGTFLEEALRDRLVCGLRNIATQKRLLAEANLTLTKALEIPQGMEAVERHAQNLKNELSDDSQTVNFLGRQVDKHSESRADICWRCTEQITERLNADLRKCLCKVEKCRNCKRLGHIARVCRKQVKRNDEENRTDKNAGRSKEASKTSKMKHVAGERDPDDDDKIMDDEQLGLHRLQIEDVDSRILVPLLLNGSSNFNFELDTGASVSVISEKTWRDDLEGIRLKKSGISLKTYTGERLKVVGKVDVNVEYEKQTASLLLLVLEGNSPSLLGRSWLRSIQLN